MDHAKYLNSLPDSHWDAWYATERAINAATDRFMLEGYSVEKAYDLAIAEVCGNV